MNRSFEMPDELNRKYIIFTVHGPENTDDNNLIKMLDALNSSDFDVLFLVYPRKKLYL